MNRAMQAIKKNTPSEPEFDECAEILISNGTQTIHVADITWHNPNRLDAFVAEINALFIRHKLAIPVSDTNKGEAR